MVGDRIKQPNSRMCFACGLENPAGLHLHFYDNGTNEVVADLTIGPDHQGYPGVAHGGVVAAILDEVGGRTMMIGDHNRFFMTAKMELKYRQPVPVGTPLRAVGHVIKQRGRLATAHAEIRSQDGETLAEAEILLTDTPTALFNAGEADRLGWRVYE
ncbi:MAG: PaaI family thioesterase [Chloroflexi bacterium]|nr:PaaI family thioesterase [Chloroflexota bacterium]